MANRKTTHPRPVAKVKAATTGAGIGQALAYFITAALRGAGVPMEDGVEFALGVVLSAGLAFLAGYITPPADEDRTQLA